MWFHQMKDFPKFAGKDVTVHVIEADDWTINTSNEWLIAYTRTIAFKVFVLELVKSRVAFCPQTCTEISIAVAP